MSIKPPKTYIVQKLDLGFVVTSDSQKIACATSEEASNVVTEFIRILDSTSKKTRVSTGKDALQFSVIAVSSPTPKLIPVHCCFISHGGTHCKEVAEFEVTYGTAPHKITESCASHIGHLIDDDTVTFTVHKITSCPNCKSTNIEQGQDCHNVCQNCNERWD